MRNPMREQITREVIKALDRKLNKAQLEIVKLTQKNLVLETRLKSRG